MLYVPPPGPPLNLTATSTASSGGSPPSAPTNVRLAQQGGTSNNLTNSQKLTWSAISGATGYNIYRQPFGGSQSLYATTSSTTYTDTAATNSNDPNYQAYITTYAYWVSATNAGGESSLVAPAVYLMEHGTANQGQTDLSYGIPPASENWNGTLGGRSCAIFNFNGGGFQPTSDPTVSPHWDLQIGHGFTRYTVDVYLSSGSFPDHQMTLGCAARIPLAAGGDAFGWRGDINILDGTWGTTPALNTWQTYTFTMDNIGFGQGTFTGSVSGSTLTITSITGPNLVGAGCRITGPGIPANTIIQSHNQSNSVGTFTLSGPGVPFTATLSANTGKYQKTSCYKPSFNRPSGGAWTIGFDNFGFLP